MAGLGVTILREFDEGNLFVIRDGHERTVAHSSKGDNRSLVLVDILEFTIR